MQNDRWFLSAPRTRGGIEVDPRHFTEGVRYDGQTDYPGLGCTSKLTQGKDYGHEAPFEISISAGARPLAFTLGSFEMPIVTERIAEHLQAFCGDSIQLLPARIHGFRGRFEIVNVLRVIRAVDEIHSEIAWRTIEDSVSTVRRIYSGISKLVLDESTIAKASIFRLEGWECALIVSADLKGLLESLGVTGIAFQPLASQP